MSDIFLKIFNMSITAGWLVLAVVVLRILLKKAPRWITCLLWGIVALRLIMPFSIESVVSLIPSKETIPENIAMSQVPVIDSGIPVINETINPIVSESLAPSPEASVNPVQIVLSVAAIVWLVGIVVMLSYSIFSYIRLYRKVGASLKCRDNIFYCDDITSPFILGIIKPRIYLPSGIDKEQMEFVIEHEKAHLKRKDHLWKPFGYALLSVYWFNPAMWVAYILLCRDIEKACDEKVIMNMDTESKKAYSRALLDCSVQRRMILACPLAFGEVGVKSRVKSVLNYKKPAFWIVIVAIIAGIVVSVCFLTDPESKEPEKPGSITHGVREPITFSHDEIEYKYISGSIVKDEPYVYAEWTNGSAETICFGNEFVLYKNDSIYYPATENAWKDILNIVYPEETVGEKYDLSVYGILEEGNYRIEKEFYFESEPENKYKVSVSFDVNRQYTFNANQYMAEEMVFENKLYAPIVFDGSSWQYCITEDMYLLFNDYPVSSSSASWSYIGKLEKIQLDKSSFDNQTTGSEWAEGYSAESLRKNNLNAFCALNKDDNSSTFLLEQKNGEIYIAYGYEDSIRWIFRMKENLPVKTDGENKEETTERTFYLGNHYVYNLYATSAIIDIEPAYCITQDFLSTSYVGQRETNEISYTDIGKLTDVALNKENFDNLFSEKGHWFDGFSAATFREGVTRARYHEDHVRNAFYYYIERAGKIYILHGGASEGERTVYMMMETTPSSRKP